MYVCIKYQSFVEPNPGAWGVGTTATEVQGHEPVLQPRVYVGSINKGGLDLGFGV